MNAGWVFVLLGKVFGDSRCWIEDERDEKAEKGRIASVYNRERLQEYLLFS